MPTDEAPMMFRPDDDTAIEPGWIPLTYGDDDGDDVDDTPLSELSASEVDQRLDAVADD